MRMFAPAPSNAIAALEGNLWASWSRFGKGNGCHLHDEPDTLWYETPIQTFPYSGVLRFAATRGADAAIDRIFERFQHRNVLFVWIVHPSAAPMELDEKLRSRGLEEAEVADGMWANLSLLPIPGQDPAGIEIRQVTSTSERDAVLDLVKWRWGCDRAIWARFATSQELGRHVEQAHSGRLIRTRHGMKSRRTGAFGPSPLAGILASFDPVESPLEPLPV